MVDLPGGEAAALAIHRAFARPVRYTGAGLTNAPLTAVRSHGPASGLMVDDSARQLGFELRKADLPQPPELGDTLAENDGAGPTWEVIEVIDGDEVGAWRVIVRAP